MTSSACEVASGQNRESTPFGITTTLSVLTFVWARIRSLTNSETVMISRARRASLGSKNRYQAAKRGLKLSGQSKTAVSWIVTTWFFDSSGPVLDGLNRSRPRSFVGRTNCSQAWPARPRNEPFGARRSACPSHRARSSVVYRCTPVIGALSARVLIAICCIHTSRSAAGLHDEGEFHREQATNHKFNSPARFQRSLPGRCEPWVQCSVVHALSSLGCSDKHSTEPLPRQTAPTTPDGSGLARQSHRQQVSPAAPKTSPAPHSALTFLERDCRVCTG